MYIVINDTQDQYPQFQILLLMELRHLSFLTKQMTYDH